MAKPRYRYRHQQERAKWAAIITRQGGAICARCGTWISATQPWDLGHPTGRDGGLAPEHASCNRSEGAARGNRMRNPTTVTNPASRNW